MKYHLTPLHLQFDYGFGLTADAFKSFAEKSEALLEVNSFEPTHLPYNFLLRHSIELYLKGIIVTIQKKLSLPKGYNNSDPFLYMEILGKFVSIENEHSIKVLFDYFKKLITDNKSSYNSFTKTDWTDFPEGLQKNVELIQSVDSDSTQFRYPKTKNTAFDVAKSSMKKAKPEDILRKANDPNSPPVTVMAFKNEHDEIVETYVLDDNPTEKLTKALKEVVDILSVANFGIHCEFAER
jgi:hypothetical protein